MSSTTSRTLVLVGLEGEDELMRAVQSEAQEAFSMVEMPPTAPDSDVAAAAAVRLPNGTDLDRAHVVGVVLNANGPSGASDDAGDAAALRLERALQLAKAIRGACPHAFVMLWHRDAVEDPKLRIAAFACGANMVTCFADHAAEAVRQLASIGATGSGPRRCSCDWCGASGMTADELWLHQPLYHIYEENRSGRCSACACAQQDPSPSTKAAAAASASPEAALHGAGTADADGGGGAGGGAGAGAGGAAAAGVGVVANLAVHIHEAHRPAAHGGPFTELRRPLGSAVVVHRRRDNKFLMVQEFANQGFWVPGGATDVGESLRAGAVRECLEEAGVQVELRGLADIAHLADANGKPCWRLATFYAVLADEPHAAAARPKTVPCFESAGACWVSADQLDGIPLRSERIPRTWFPHFAAGGKPLPLELPPDQAHLFPDVEF
ncbi:hypothetical protein CHLRE_05g247850v5 [Chlamydomonas reinhardtii]|uniref:Nudix hydrolase domain-containing protein n=1 Tax=Chlamydomonas reinhardtii TaxID=3055 RepID=A0A2K3DS22_CHLRE|nr:uncharacterized protein CHLRE_05g247850v5 [Chlamydomonas reinhardtii]PNW83330.1 hypothetical protein CHLRE_05g247850v5 [Chlamydomonas reinhardtii]